MKMKYFNNIIMYLQQYYYLRNNISFKRYETLPMETVSVDVRVYVFCLRM